VFDGTSLREITPPRQGSDCGTWQLAGGRHQRARRPAALFRRKGKVGDGKSSSCRQRCVGRHLPVHKLWYRDRPWLDQASSPVLLLWWRGPVGNGYARRERQRPGGV